MTKIITTTPPPIYKFLPLLIVLYFCILITATVGINKYVTIGSSYAMSGTIIFPLFFLLSDIIAEVYGYKMARLVFWSTLIGFVVFSLICYLIVAMPYPIFWHGEGDYQFVFSNIIRVTISTCVVLSFSTIINIYLISKWKILTGGKYFWLRSLGSSTLGEFIYTALNLFLMNIGVRPMGTIVIIIFWAYLFKVFFTVIFAYPGQLIATLLKKAEGSDVYDHNINFNPFKWAI